MVRTFSKIYGLSGLRAGYAVSSDVDLLAAVAPVLGVNALTQAAVEHTLRTSDAEIERRRRAVSRERVRVTEGLAALGADVTRSQANFVWVRAPGMGGDALAQALRRQGVIVAPGGPLGADDHVRAAVLDEAATNRLRPGVRERRSPRSPSGDRSRPRTPCPSCWPSAAKRAARPRRAISWGSASRPVLSCISSGASVAITVSRSAPVWAARMSAAPPGSVHQGVLTGPGQTPLTRTPCEPNSSESALVKLIIAALAAP